MFVGKASAATDCTATATTGVPQIECEALIALYNSTNGASWTNKTNWNSTSTVSTWYGVTVTGGHVFGLLNMASNNLTGTIPSEIGNLTFLTQINFFNNRLTGSISPEINNLTRLTILYLNVNQLTGAIPSLSNLTVLNSLYLDRNQLTSSIPTGLSNTLRVLTLYSNKLSGLIPSNLATTPLTTFSIQNNNFVFSDIEPGFASYSGRAGFTYSPQLNVDTTRTLSTFLAGDTLTITPSVQPNANDLYQWYKNGVAITGATSRVFTKTIKDGDNGVYTYRITNNFVTGLTIQSNNITLPIITPNPPASDSIYYNVDSSSNFWIRGSISNTKDIAQKIFGQAYLIDKTTPNLISSFTSGISMGVATDDKAPINTINTGYIMGGHGFAVPVVTSTGHDKTMADIGSTWSDGTNQFILAQISGSNLTFYPIPTSSPWISPSMGAASTLTYVSGATNTSNITVTSKITSQIAMTKNLVNHILIDGLTEASVGDAGYANHVDLVEEFDLVDPSTINRTNNPWVWTDGATWMHVKNTYTSTAGTVAIHTTYNIVRPMNLGYFSIIQVGALATPTYDHQYYYIPKTKPISIYDFKSIQLLDTGPSSDIISFGGTKVDDINNPPNRQIILKKKTAESNYDIGFAFGYGPYSDTAAEKRNCLTGTCWSVYNSSLKTYPAMVSSLGVVNNVTYDAYAYRQWIDPKQYDLGKLAYWNNQNGRDLVYVDYHRSAVNDVTALPAKFIGKQIRVVESENMQTVPTFIPSDGNLSLSTTGANTYGFAVLELTDAQSAPTSSVLTGTYNTAQSVSLSAASSTSIQYSITEMPADCSSGTTYAEPISVATSTTIYARACNGVGNSATSTFAYVIDATPPETPTATPSAGSYNSTQSVALSATGSDYIQYDLSSIPADCSSGILYVNPISVETSQTIYVRACDNAGNSSTSTFAYIIDTVNPIISLISSDNTPTIIWTTSKPASSIIDYGLTSSYGTSTIEADISSRITDHSVTISNLSACTTYHYRIRSVDDALNEGVSSDQTFTTDGCTASSNQTEITSGQIDNITGGTLTTSDNALSISIPINFASSSANFQIHQLDKTTVIAQTSVPAGYLIAGSDIYELKALSDNTTVISSFANPLTITMSYTTSDISGLDESTLKIYRWDNSNWNQLSNCNVNTSAKTVTCNTSNFSVFGIFGRVASASNGGGSGMPSSWNNKPIVPVGGFIATVNDNILTFKAGSDVKKMAISLNSNFTNASLEDYTTTKQINSCSGSCTVYIKFYTEYGVASDVISQTINVKTINPIIAVPTKPIIIIKDTKPAPYSRLAGRILLQVESHGEAWYVNPKDNKRYYLGRPDDAFNLMRTLSLGISEKEFSSWKNLAPIWAKGRLYIRPQSHGEAYYVDLNRHIHYLGRPMDAWLLLRSKGLGITNSDLAKVVIAE